MAFKKPTLPKATEAEAFINKSSGTDYSILTLDELINEYESIDQQSQLLKGRILLEARNRFKSDNDFGAWIEQVGGAICSTSRQHRTRLMNLARFFEGRELDKISISAAYEISAPVNADIAVEVYEEVRGKNVPLAEVRRKIALKKVVPNTSIVPADDVERFEEKYKPVGIVETTVRIIPTNQTLIVGRPIDDDESDTKIIASEKTENVGRKEIETISTESGKTKQEQIMEILEGLTGGEAKKVLRDCLHLVKW